MNAQDLRIGNWVKIEFNPEYPNAKPNTRVYSIGCDDIMRLEFLINGIEESWINPIELTPEILEKVGFVEREGNYIWYDYDLGDGFYFVLRYTKISCHLYLYNNSQKFATSTFIKSFHELQNAFYFINGKELKIEL